MPGQGTGAMFDLSDERVPACWPSLLARLYWVRTALQQKAPSGWLFVFPRPLGSLLLTEVWMPAKSSEAEGGFVSPC